MEKGNVIVEDVVVVIGMYVNLGYIWREREYWNLSYIDNIWVVERMFFGRCSGIVISVWDFGFFCCVFEKKFDFCRVFFYLRV